jgi:hypothetical protein
MTHNLVGKRIRLLAMPKDPDPIASGSEGTVTSVAVLTNDWMQIMVDWDSGRTLSLAVPPDVYELV